MRLILVGTNHMRSPMEFRERLSFSGDKLNEALRDLYWVEGVGECLILSTCNRTEFLALFEAHSYKPGRIIDFVAELSGYSPEKVKEYTYYHKNEETARHIFRVAGGLNSMVLGETQILGQVKDAYRAAVKAKTSGPVLNKLMHTCFQTAKRVRSETAIGEGTLSVAKVACDLAEKVYEDLADRRVLIIGAGENSELTARILRKKNVRRIRIANRTRERAERLAKQFDAEVGDFGNLIGELKDADIIISSTAAQDYILSVDDVRQVTKDRDRPLFLVDLAVPRDFDPKISSIEGVLLYDIDELGELVAANRKKREAECEKAEEIIAEDTKRFMEWHSQFKVTPTIKELQQRIERIRRKEVEGLRSILDDEAWEQVNAATLRMARRMLAHPIICVKDVATKPDSGKMIDFIHDVFGLEKSPHK